MIIEHFCQEEITECGIKRDESVYGLPVQSLHILIFCLLMCSEAGSEGSGSGSGSAICTTRV